mmetsp:Transcript_28484/g.72590  ORF Transcript_28484/g.72590 Transcript_28484/m.72590 type:complete len:109 (-) Transcript_28484:361-687(-)
MHVHTCKHTCTRTFTHAAKMVFAYGGEKQKDMGTNRRGRQAEEKRGKEEEKAPNKKRKEKKRKQKERKGKERSTSKPCTPFLHALPHHTYIECGQTASKVTILKEDHA